MGFDGHPVFGRRAEKYKAVRIDTIEAKLA